MKPSNQVVKSSLLAVLLTSAAFGANAVTFGVDPSAGWIGFMNVFELPSNGGAYVFGSGWGTADLCASFSGTTLTLSPNTVNDPSTFWYQGGGAPGAPGNKIMDANFYQDFGGIYAGQTVTFTGLVLDNSLTSAHTSVAFIKDFAPDYSSFIGTTVALTPGVFNLTLAALNDPNRHVQIGFETIGVNVWSTDVGPFGKVDITAVPEPSSMAVFFGGIACLIRARRNRVAERK
jgi:hypothetical protein